MKSVKAAVEYMKCKENENHILLIFSDCIDENILQKNNRERTSLKVLTNKFFFFIDKQDSYLIQE